MKMSVIAFMQVIALVLLPISANQGPSIRSMEGFQKKSENAESNTTLIKELSKILSRTHRMNGKSEKDDTEQQDIRIKRLEHDKTAAVVNFRDFLKEREVCKYRRYSHIRKRREVEEEEEDESDEMGEMDDSEVDSLDFDQAVNAQELTNLLDVVQDYTNNDVFVGKSISTTTSPNPIMWKRLRNFMVRKIPFLCLLYIKNEMKVEAILAALLNAGSAPVHRVLMNYCRKKVENAQPCELIPPPNFRNGFVRAFGWLNRAFGKWFKGKHKLEEPQLNAGEVKNIEEILEADAASSGITPKITYDLSSTKNEPVPPVHPSITKPQSPPLSQPADDPINPFDNHVPVEKPSPEKMGVPPKSGSIPSADNNAGAPFSEELHHHPIKDQAVDDDDSDSEDGVDDDLNALDRGGKIIKATSVDPLERELWKGVAQSYKQALHEDLNSSAPVTNKEEQGSETQELDPKDRRRRSHKRIRVDKSCSSRECELKKIRAALKRVATPMDSTSDLDDLTELLAGFIHIPEEKKVKKKEVKRYSAKREAKARRGREERKKKDNRERSRKANDDSYPEEEVLNFFEQYTLPPFFTENIEDIAKTADIVPASGMGYEKHFKQHHHHPVNSKNNKKSWWDLVVEYQIPIIVTGTILGMLLLIIIFSCLRRCCHTARCQCDEDDSDANFIDITVSGMTDAEYKDVSPTPMKNKGIKLGKLQIFNSEKKSRRTTHRNESKSSAENTDQEPWLQTEGSYQTD